MPLHFVDINSDSFIKNFLRSFKVWWDFQMLWGKQDTIYINRIVYVLMNSNVIEGNIKPAFKWKSILIHSSLA